MAVSKRLRYEVLRRDNHQCRYCGATAPDAKLTVDHVLPVALGGTDEATNLVTACADCNGGKSASAPDAALVADVSQDQVRWGRAMALAVEQRTAELTADRARTAEFDAQWLSWAYADGSKIMRPGNWKSSVLRFMAAGLDGEFLADAIETAAGNPKLRNADVWRYFCGICWREIEKIQELAATHVSAEGGGRPEQVDDQLPYGAGFAAGFDTLNLAESYIAEVLEAVSAPDGVLKWATNGFWDAMQAAYTAFCGARPDVEDAEHLANEQAAEAFDRAAVQSIAEIVILCHTRVTDGA